MAIRENVSLIVDVQPDLAKLDRLEQRLKKRLSVSIKSDTDSIKDAVDDIDGGDVTTNVSASGVRETRREVQSLQSDMRNIVLANNVDHRPLHALNEHLSLKQAHLRQVRADFAKPIMLGGYSGGSGGGYGAPKGAGASGSGTAASVGDLVVELDVTQFSRAVKDFGLSSAYLIRDLGKELRRSSTGNINPFRTAAKVIGGTLNVAASAIAAPLKAVGKVTGNVAAGAVHGFGEQAGHQAFQGLFDKKLFTETRKLADYTGMINKEFVNLERGTAKFLSVLTQTANPKTALVASAPEFASDAAKAPVLELAKVLEIMQAPNQRETITLVQRHFPDKINNNKTFQKSVTANEARNALKEKKAAVNKQLKEAKTSGKTEEVARLQADMKGIKKALSSAVSAVKVHGEDGLREVMQGITNDAIDQYSTAYGPLLKQMQPLLRVIQDVQSFTAIDQATKRKDQLVAEQPTNNKDSLVTIGGAQNAGGEGGRQVAEWLRPYFSDSNIIPVANPDTDAVNDSKLLKPLLDVFIPSISNNPAFSETIDNVEAQVLGGINPMLRSAASIEALAQILAAKEVNGEDAQVGVLSYSLGGAEAIRLAAALDLMDMEVRKGVKVLAAAYPHLRILDKDYSTLTAAVVDADPVAAPYFTGFSEETETGTVLKDANVALGSGASAHGFHHLLKSPTFRGLLEGMGGDFQGDDNKSVATSKKLSDIYSIVGSLGQVRSVLETGDFDTSQPSKGFAGDATTFGEMTESISKALRKGTDGLDPRGAATISATKAEASALIPLLVEQLGRDGVEVETEGKSDRVIADDINALFQGQFFNDFLTQVKGEGEGGNDWAPENVKGLEQLPAIINNLKDYISWAEKENFTGDMEQQLVDAKYIRDTAKGQLESGEFNREELVGNIKERGVDPQLKEGVYAKQLDTFSLPGVEDIRSLPEGTEQFATDMPEAIPAYNRLADALGNLMPAATLIERGAAGMSGAVTLLTKDFAYKTDVDPEKIASDNEVGAYERLAGRFAPLIAQGDKGQALVTERIQGNAVKDLLSALVQPAKEAKKKLKKYTTEKADAENDIKVGTDERKQAKTPEERKAATLKVNDAKARVKELGPLIKAASKEFTAIQGEFNTHATELYTYVGRLGASLNDLGVAHNDLAAGNVFITGLTDVDAAVQDIHAKYQEMQDIKAKIKDLGDGDENLDESLQLKRRYNELEDSGGALGGLGLDDNVTSIDLGNTSLVEPGARVKSDKLTTQFRSVADTEFWGIMNNAQMWKSIAEGYRNPLAERDVRNLEDVAGGLPVYDEATAGKPLPLGAKRDLNPIDNILSQDSVSAAAEQLGAIGNTLKELVDNLKAQSDEKIAQAKEAADNALSIALDVKARAEGGVTSVTDKVTGVVDAAKEKGDEGRGQRITANTQLENAEEAVFDLIDRASGGRVDGEGVKNAVKNTTDNAVASGTVMFTDQYAQGMQRQNQLVENVASMVPLLGKSEGFKKTSAAVVRLVGDTIVMPMAARGLMGAHGGGELIATLDHVLDGAETALVHVADGAVDAVTGSTAVVEHSEGILSHAKDLITHPGQAVHNAEKAVVRHGVKDVEHRAVHDLTHKAPEAAAGNKISQDLEATGSKSLDRRANKTSALTEKIASEIDQLDEVGYNMVSGAIKQAKTMREVEKILSAKVKKGKVSRNSFVDGELGEDDKSTFLEKVGNGKEGYLYRDELEEIAKQVGVTGKQSKGASKARLAKLITASLVRQGEGPDKLATLVEELFAKGGVKQSAGLSSKVQSRKMGHILNAAGRIEGDAKKAFSASGGISDDMAGMPDDLLDIVEGLERVLDELEVAGSNLPAHGRPKALDARITSVQQTLSRGKIGEAYIELQNQRRDGVREPKAYTPTPIGASNGSTGIDASLDKAKAERKKERQRQQDQLADMAADVWATQQEMEILKAEIISDDQALGLAPAATSDSKALTTISDASPKGQDIGYDINAGMEGGLTDSMNLPINAMEEAVEAVIDEAKEGFDIHSPSRIFFKMGEDDMEGLANGIVAGGPGVEKALSQVIEQAKDIDLSILDGAELAQLGEELEEWANLTQTLVDNSASDSALAELNEFSQRMAIFSAEYSDHVEDLQTASKKIPELAPNFKAHGLGNIETIDTKPNVAGKFLSASGDAQANREGNPVAKGIGNAAQEAKRRIIEVTGAIDGEGAEKGMDLIISKLREATGGAGRLFEGMGDVTQAIFEAGSRLTGGAFSSQELQNLIGSFKLLEKVGVASFGAIAASMIGFALSSTSAAVEMKQITVQMKAVGIASADFDELGKVAAKNSLNYRGLVETTFQLKGALIDTASENQAGAMAAQIERIGLALQVPEERLDRFRVAIQQMASKGVISMEELRQQAAEAVPQIVGATSQALGVQREQLTAVISSGTVSSSRNLPKILDILEKQTGDGLSEAQNSLPAVRNRLDGVSLRAKAKAGEAPLKTITLVASAVADAVVAAEPLLKIFSTVAGDMAALVTGLGAVAGGYYLITYAAKAAQLATTSLWAAVKGLSLTQIGVIGAVAAGYGLYRKLKADEKAADDLTQGLQDVNDMLTAIDRDRRIKLKIDSKDVEGFGTSFDSKGENKASVEDALYEEEASKEILKETFEEEGAWVGIGMLIAEGFKGAINPDEWLDKIDPRNLKFIGHLLPTGSKEVLEKRKTERIEDKENRKDRANKRDQRKAAKIVGKELDKFDEKLPNALGDGNFLNQVAAYKKGTEELRNQIGLVDTEIKLIGSGRGDTSRLPALQKQLEGLQKQEAGLGDQAFDGFGIEKLDKAITKLKQNKATLEKARGDGSGVIDPELEKQIERVDARLNTLVARKRTIDIAMNVNVIDDELAKAEGEYEDALGGIRAVNTEFYAGLVADRIAYQTTDEQMGLQEAQLEKQTVDAKIAELDRYRSARLAILKEDESFGAAEALLRTTGASSADSATNGQINEAISVASSSPNFAAQEKVLNVLKDLKQAEDERIDLQKESAQASLQQAAAERTYLASLRDVLGVTERLARATDSDTRVFDRQRQEAQNRVAARRVDSPIELGENAKAQQQRGFDDDLSGELISVLQDEINVRRGRIDEYVKTANILNKAERAVATELLGGINLTSASIHRLNGALATLDDDEAKGKPVSANIRSALEAQLSSIELDDQNIAAEGAILQEEQAIKDREEQNIHKVTERQVRDLQQSMADSVREMMRNFQDLMQSLDNEIYTIGNELARAQTEGNIMGARNKLIQTLGNLDSPFVALFDSVASAITDIQDLTIQANERMRDLSQRPLQWDRQLEDYAIQGQRRIQSLNDSFEDATGQDQAIAIAGQRGEISVDDITGAFESGAGSVGGLQSEYGRYNSPSPAQVSAPPSSPFVGPSSIPTVPGPGGGAALGNGTPVYVEIDLQGILSKAKGPERQSLEDYKKEISGQQARDKNLFLNGQKLNADPWDPQGRNDKRWGIPKEVLGTVDAPALHRQYEALRKQSHATGTTPAMLKKAQDIVEQLKAAQPDFTRHDGSTIAGYGSRAEVVLAEDQLKQLEASSAQWVQVNGVPGAGPNGGVGLPDAGVGNAATLNSTFGLLDTSVQQSSSALISSMYEQQSANELAISAQTNAAKAMNTALGGEVRKLLSIQIANRFLALQKELQQQVREINKIFREFPLGIKRLGHQLQDFRRQDRPLTPTEERNRRHEEIDIQGAEIKNSIIEQKEQAEGLLKAISEGETGDTFAEVRAAADIEYKDNPEALKELRSIVTGVEAIGREGNQAQHIIAAIADKVEDPDKAKAFTGTVNRSQYLRSEIGQSLTSAASQPGIDEDSRAKALALASKALGDVDLNPDEIREAIRLLNLYGEAVESSTRTAKANYDEEAKLRRTLADDQYEASYNSNFYDLQEQGIGSQLTTSSFERQSIRARAEVERLEDPEAKEARRKQYVRDNAGTGRTEGELSADIAALEDLELSNAKQQIDSVGLSLKEGLGNILKDTLVELFTLEGGFKSLGENILTSMRDLFAQIAAEIIKAQILKGVASLFDKGGKDGGDDYDGGGGGGGAGEAAGGILGLVTTIFGLFADGGEIQNAADGMTIGAAYQKERVLSGGKKPQLVMAHVGEEILSTRNGDAQLWRTMKETGAYDLIREGKGNFAGGGTVGNANSTAQSLRHGRYPNDNNGGGSVHNDYSVKIDRVNDYESFRRSRAQISSHQRRKGIEAERRALA